MGTEVFTDIEVIIRDHPDIKGVICGNDEIALGAVAALKGAGKGDVIVVSIDGSEDVLDYIKAGEIRLLRFNPVHVWRKWLLSRLIYT